jgi:hypothetical protein
MSENSAGSGTAKRLEDLIADTQSCIRALDRRLRNLEEASRVAAEQARTDQVPGEENPLPLPAGAAAPSTAPTLAAPRVLSYRVYLREYMKRGRQRQALGDD